MFLDSLYDQILLSPQRNGADELFAVSGYASATFANRHISEAGDFSLNLLVGMPGSRADHAGWLGLSKRYGERLTVHYLESAPFVHCKAYGWFRKGEALEGFTGSANYTQPGFLSSGQINQMVTDNPSSIRDLYESLLARAIHIHDFQLQDAAESMDFPALTIEGSTLPGDVEWLVPGVAVKISLLARDGTLPARSGLNWGQRPELNRDPDQAYLPLRKDAREEGYLPERGYTFTLVTDDNQALDCVVAQDGRKAIQSTEDNSLLGSYIRSRLGVEPGSFLTNEDLIEYGRTDFTLIKIDDETIKFDFSVGQRRN